MPLDPLDPTVVVLLSDKRSGSSLVERELCSHPLVSHVQYTEHSVNETLYWLKAALLLEAGDAGFSRGRRPTNLGDGAQVRESLIAGLERNVDGFVPPSDDRELVFAGWEALCSHYARPVFFEKSPQHLHNWCALELLLEWLQRTAFRVRVIGLVRNPMAVLYSAEQQFGTPAGDRQYSWLQAYENLERFRAALDPARYFSLVFEDLAASPHARYADLCRFIGIEPMPAMGDTVDAEKVEAWRHDPAFQLRLDDSVQALATRFGYTTAQLTHTAGKGDGLIVSARRRLARTVTRTRGGIMNRLRKFRQRHIEK